MSYPDIALVGYAGSGKDTVAEYLVREYGYRRIALADPVRAAALSIDPWIVSEVGTIVRLSVMVRRIGWELAKRDNPEVRRTLQQVGTSIRALNQDFWLNLLEEQILDTPEDTPIVVTDVRFLNEAHALCGQDGSGHACTSVRIIRPGCAPDGHVSESELAGYATDYTLINDSTIGVLHSKIETLLSLAR